MEMIAFNLFNYKKAKIVVVTLLNVSFRIFESLCPYNCVFCDLYYQWEILNKHFYWYSSAAFVAWRR